ncbi:High osmolarity signaling protein SHO1 [Leucoagaricus sp. SymC.cos]|nr:High osmolarity signaling protein SHO1 [Leucoagaricus sp. SymC.cos]
MDESGPATYHSVDYSRSLGKSYIFLLTLALSIVGWFMSLVSQAVVTAKQGNATVGTLWFGIVLQLGVILGLLISWSNDTLFQYGIALAIFAALASSFGAQGVHLNVFNGTQAQKALSAGWLVTCIVDVLWILILSSEPSSLVYRFVATNGQVRRQSAHMNGGAIPNVGSNMEAFVPKYTTAEGIPLEVQQPMMAPGSVAGSNADNRGSRMHSSVGGEPESHRRRSAGVWSTPPQTPGGGRPGSMRDVPPVPEGPIVEPPVVPLGEGMRPTSGSHLGTNRPDSTAQTTTDMTQMPPQPLPRALALFDYTASPTDAYELTFTKGEVLEIVDKSGKWWEAVKSDGTKGIAPSNYLKVM